MGSKSRAKQLMQKAGVPVVPGYHGDKQDFKTLRNEAEKIGFPLLIKPVAGGGGRGMRVVRQVNELEEALTLSRSEAKNAFGDDNVLLERFIGALVMSNFRSLVINTEILSISMNENARFNADTRKSLRKVHLLFLMKPSESKWLKPH